MTTKRCRSTESHCVCSLADGHEDATHVCECGGSWTYDPDGTFQPVTFPGGIEVSIDGMFTALDNLMRADAP